MFQIPFSFQKSIDINSNQESVFSQIQDFAHWSKWSPWLILEPKAKVFITGPYGQVGHMQKWEGNQIGSGQIKIIKIDKLSKIDFEVEFLKPWKSKSLSSFHCEAHGSKTRLTWSFEGTLPFFLFFLKRMMTGMVGQDYVRGLNMIKDLVELGSINSSIENLGKQPKNEFHFFGIKRSCSVSEISLYASQDIKKALQLLHSIKAQTQTSKMLCPKFDFSTLTCEYIAGFELKAPLDSAQLQILEQNKTDDWRSLTVPKHQTLDIKHFGPYRHIANAWTKANMQLRSEKLKALKKVFPYETYISMGGMGDVKDDKTIETIISIPIK